MAKNPLRVATNEYVRTTNVECSQRFRDITFRSLMCDKLISLFETGKV